MQDGFDVLASLFHLQSQAAFDYGVCLGIDASLSRNSDETSHPDGLRIRSDWLWCFVRYSFYSHNLTLSSRLQTVLCVDMD
jgi:hypothetical protein